MDASAFDDPPEGNVEECSLVETFNQIENDLELPVSLLLHWKFDGADTT